MKIVNKTGYLKGAKTANNPVNIIPSNLITTQGMAFPIKANGKTLYPNTGQYKFPTSPVVETPLKQQGTKSAKTFGQAFAEASKAGKSTFNFNGKSFTTEKKDVSTKDNKVTSWIKNRILERVTPTTYETIPRVSEFIAGEKYNPSEKIFIDGSNTSLKGDYDALALSLGRKTKYNTVVPQTKYKPISDKSLDKKYYSINDLDKKKLVEKYYEGKKEMEKLNKKYPGKIDYGFLDKTIDFLPDYLNKNFISRKALRENAEKKLLKDYREKGVVYQKDEGMYKDNSSYGPMSNFGTWEGKDKKGKYISYKDKIDYEGSLLGKIAKPILNQKDVDIYDRIYLDKEGNPIKKNGAKLVKAQNGKLSVSANNKKQFRDVAKIKDNEPSFSFLDYPQKQLLRVIGGSGKENYADILRRKANTPGHLINKLDKYSPTTRKVIGVAGNIFTDPLNYAGGAAAKGLHGLYAGAKTLAKTKNLVRKAKSIRNLAYGVTAGNVGRDISSALDEFKKGSKGVSLAFSRGEKDPKGGLTQKGVDKYNRATGGNLKMAVTTPPSKLKPGSKAANRRKSFCARMSGVKGPMRKPNGKPTRKALALRKWNC